ncbi:RNA polymerase sigma-70 factor (ECF subfamily) [Tahibacter aquaticus]|uniref:RNA polymerase sigma-70 factor (ECF subfamily) n=1 Tax=Tahibacter aquaticus TaxID=520092 RepID=A0A4R6Z6N5_9GAMM|nr:RNA polymerase sigma factor [Tahibacter aquaticus]TDR47364.1 RNA polymerase sigma-70 factor (ECF subfamily) [Tahibacter aquaticus]
MKRDSERIYDEFLVAAAITGDRQALVRLVTRWQPRLLRHAWRVLGNADGAKDMVQEAWMEILKGLARLDDLAAFPAWAYRIVTRRCQRTFLARGRVWRAPETGEFEPNLEAPEHASGEFAADLNIVLKAIGRLPATQRAAMALFYLEDLSVAEIAIATDVPPGTVKTRLMHARRKVRAILEGEDS